MLITFLFTSSELYDLNSIFIDMWKKVCINQSNEYLFFYNLLYPEIMTKSKFDKLVLKKSFDRALSFLALLHIYMSSIYYFTEQLLYSITSISNKSCTNAHAIDYKVKHLRKNFQRFTQETLIARLLFCRKTKSSENNSLS